MTPASTGTIANTSYGVGLPWEPWPNTLHQWTADYHLYVHKMALVVDVSKVQATLSIQCRSHCCQRGRCHLRIQDKQTSKSFGGTQDEVVAVTAGALVKMTGFKELVQRSLETTAAPLVVNFAHGRAPGTQRPRKQQGSCEYDQTPGQARAVHSTHRVYGCTVLQRDPKAVECHGQSCHRTSLTTDCCSFACPVDTHHGGPPPRITLPKVRKLCGS